MVHLISGIESKQNFQYCERFIYGIGVQIGRLLLQMIAGRSIEWLNTEINYFNTTKLDNWTLIGLRIAIATFFHHQHAIVSFLRIIDQWMWLIISNDARNILDVFNLTTIERRLLCDNQYVY